MKKSKSEKKNKDNTEWRNVIQLLPCKKQKSVNYERILTEKIESIGLLSKSNPDIVMFSKGMNQNNNNKDSSNNNTTQKDLIVSNQDNQRTSSNSKNSFLSHPVMISESDGKIEISAITSSEKQGCQCACLIV